MSFDKSILLETIRVPKNLMYLTDRLPGANYENSIDGDSANFMKKHASSSDYKLPSIKKGDI
jgi:hypothetical protein